MKPIMKIDKENYYRSCCLLKSMTIQYFYFIHKCIYIVYKEFPLILFYNIAVLHLTIGNNF